MSQLFKLLDVVALLKDCPELGLHQGQVGTIVDVYEPNVFEVEFSDIQGRTYALESLRTDQLMQLHHQPIGEKILLSSVNMGE